jgi:hypothetical protein
MMTMTTKTTVDYITLKIVVASTSDGTHDFKEEFDPADSDLQGTIDAWVEEKCEELNDDLADGEDEYTFEESEVHEFDAEFGHPNDFDNLNDYGEYAENVEKFGEAFHLRWEDVGDIDRRAFENHYQGSHNTQEEWAESVYTDLYTIPDNLKGHINWESAARELAMDHTVYEGDDGYHIFHG